MKSSVRQAAPAASRTYGPPVAGQAQPHGVAGPGARAPRWVVTRTMLAMRVSRSAKTDAFSRWWTTRTSAVGGEEGVVDVAAAEGPDVGELALDPEAPAEAGVG